MVGCTTGEVRWEIQNVVGAYILDAPEKHIQHPASGPPKSGPGMYWQQYRGRLPRRRGL
jgi:hypothetical protein